MAFNFHYGRRVALDFYKSVQHTRYVKQGFQAATCSPRPISQSPVARALPETRTLRQADLWVASLKPSERAALLTALQKHNETPADTKTSTPLATRDLIHAGVFYGLPFVGFGFLDNFIMIIAGDYIDLTIGATLGISTMAAAALGNAISDVAGIGSAWYVEIVVSKLGMQQPNFDPEQMNSTAARWAINIGKAIGVTIGCILGMIPLLVLPTSEDKEREKEQKKA